MPSYKVHAVFGFLFVVVIIFLLYFYDLINLNAKILFYIPAILVFALLPDLDSGSSIIRRSILTLLILIFIGSSIMFFMTHDIMYIAPITIIIILNIIIKLSKHRGLMHNIITGIILASPLLVIDWGVALAAFFAYFSHLLLDGKLI